MRYCAVLNCLNKDKKHLFRFPQIESILIKWIKATGRKNWIPTESSAICEIHFKLEDFSNTKLRKRLKPDAIPSENINEIFPSIEKAVQQISIENNTDCSQIAEDNENREILEENEQNFILIEETRKQVRKRTNSEEIEEIKIKIQKLEEENSKMKHELQASQENYNQQLQSQTDAFNYLIKEQKRASSEKLNIKNKQLKILRNEVKRRNMKLKDLLEAAKTKNMLSNII